MAFENKEMDNAAVQAEIELSTIPDEEFKVMAQWFTKWYLTAGYKRLGRIIVQNGKRFVGNK